MSHDLLRIAWSFAVAANNLDLVGYHSLAGILHFEGDIFDEECPDLIAESVGIQVALCYKSALPLCTPSSKPYLERQPRLYLICQELSNATIKVRQDLHRQLRFDTTRADQIIESVCESHADAKGENSQYTVARLM